MERFVSNPIDAAADELAEAIRSGRVGDEKDRMQLVVNTLIMCNPGAQPPPKLCAFSLLAGAAFARGVDKAKKEEA